MPDPGLEMSGGPLDENRARMSAPAPSEYNSFTVVPSTVTVPDVPIKLPLVNETIAAGMVGCAGVPSCPIAVGSPSWLLITKTPVAPAVWAFLIFVENVQVPRWIKAILPEKLSVIGLQPCTLVAELTTL